LDNAFRNNPAMVQPPKIGSTAAPKASTPTVKIGPTGGAAGDYKGPRIGPAANTKPFGGGR